MAIATLGMVASWCAPIPLASRLAREQVGVSDRMNPPPGAEMVLVYDLRRDRRYREQILSGVEDQWQAYLRGERPVSVAEGRITRLFHAPYEGEPMFELKEGPRGSSWTRHGDQSWYAVGLRAKVESFVFRADFIGDMMVLTRIWIGK